MAAVQEPVAVPGLEKNMDNLSLEGKPSGPLKTPIVHPEHVVAPIPPPELTADQEAKYQTLLETAKSWTEIPSTEGKGGPITDSESMWLSKECLLRYLRATKWSTAEATKRLLGTLTWRREYGVEELSPDTLSVEGETGKQFVLGVDIAGRPCLYMNPGRQNTDVSPQQVQHLVFMLERAIEFQKPGQETLALLINFKTSKNRSNTAPGIGQGREVLNILQTHYPERLGRALVINVPWLVWGFFKLITPFIDPATKEKLKFNEDVRQHVPPQQLWKEYNGDLDFDYDHSVYWPALIKETEAKHAARMERWVKAGKHIGESEFYLKGGDAPSVAASSTIAEPTTSAVEAAPKETGVEDSGAEKKDLATPGQSNHAQTNGTGPVAQVGEAVVTEQ